MGQPIRVLIADDHAGCRLGLRTLLSATEELEVLKLVAKGLLNDEIAERLVITDATVRTHVSNIMGKLQVANRTQAALYALRTGLTTLEEDREAQHKG